MNRKEAAMGNCQVRGCVVKSWGHVSGPLAIPHAPTELQPFTSRCLETCSHCKSSPCGKANGHQWSCNCHAGKCHELHGEKVVR